MAKKPQSNTVNQRQKSYRFGVVAETVALFYLLLKGYRPLARRYGGKGGEIDLIMQRGRVIIFVEVKARNKMNDALNAIHARKRMLIARTAKKWLAQNHRKHPEHATHTLRADAVMLAPWRMPHHITNAFSFDF